MNLTHNNQKQILPYSGITMSSIKNSQVSGFYDHNLNKFILKYNESKLNNKNITFVSSTALHASASAGSVDSGVVEGFLGLSAKKVGPNLGSQTSFEHLTEYNYNLNSQFNKLNNKNQIISNLKKMTVCTTDTEFEQQKDMNKKSTLISKGTEYLGGINILTPVKIKNNTVSISNKITHLSHSTFQSPAQNPNPLGLVEWSEVKGGFSSSLTKDTSNIGALANEGYRKSQIKVNMNTFVSKYLKSFSKFNLDIATSQFLVYKFNNNKQKIISNITSILKNSFYSMYSIISRPVLEISPNKVTINLFFFVSRNKNRRQIGSSYNNLKFLSTNHKQLQFLCINLSKYLKKPVELELIRLYYPYNDSQILANSIGQLSKNIRNRFRTLVDNTFNFSKIKNPTKMIMLKNSRISILPSFLTGIKIRLGGRLLSQKVVPRFTVQTFQEGSLARTKANVVTSSRFTHKNKRGTFSITVSVGQGFF